jgi:hypothetical protein
VPFLHCICCSPSKNSGTIALMQLGIWNRIFPSFC